MEDLGEKQGGIMDTQQQIDKAIKDHEAKLHAKTKRFKPPTIDEIEAEIKEKEYDIDPITFFYNYEANGWKRGKTKMSNWKAALVTWNRSDIGQKNTRKRRLCSIHNCNKLGIYKGYDMTGQASWKCEVHKQKQAKSKAPELYKPKKVPKPVPPKRVASRKELDALER